MMFGLFKKPKITEEDLQAEIVKIKAEQKHQRMYITPPPLLVWSELIIGKDGYMESLGRIQTNQKDIDRWGKEHYDWLPDK